MIIDNKEFTNIPGYIGYFICKETTEVASHIKRNNECEISTKILDINAAKDHYYRTQFIKDGKKINVTVHRLMALTFIPNPEDKKTVNHIDGNKLNNQLSNLEWATFQENSQHAVDTGLTTHTYCEVPILQYTKDGSNFIQEFKSAAEAMRLTGVEKMNISKVLRGIRPRAGGFHWKYK